MRRVSVALLLACIASCSSESGRRVEDRASPTFESVFRDAPRILLSLRSTLGRRFNACGALVGNGACRTAWNASIERGDFPALVTTLTEACGAQYCRQVSEPKPRACTVPAAGWASAEIAVCRAPRG